MISLQVNNGQLDWQTSFGGGVLAAPIADTGGVYVVNETRASKEINSKEATIFIRSLSPASGVVRWFLPLPQTVRHISDAQSSILILDTLGNDVIGIDKDIGVIKWSLQLPHRIIPALITIRGHLYIPQENGEITILTQEDGQSVGHYRTLGDLNSFAMDQGGMLFIGTSKGLVAAYSEVQGSLILRWRKRLSAEIQSFSQTDDGILIACRDNSITYLRKQDGRKLWKKHLDDRLIAPPTLTKDAVLFAALGEDVCPVLSLRDGRQVNTLSIGKDNSVVAPPIIAGNFLLVPTKIGLLAFSASE